MQLKKAEWCKSWMTEEEKRIMKRQMAAMRRLFKNANVPESPLLSIRAIDIGIHQIMAQRLENTLAPTINENGEITSEITGALAEQIGKTRERLRKAIRELEDACARLGKPVEIGLADELLPIIRKTKHLLNSPLPKREDTPVPESAANTHNSSDAPTRRGNIPVPESTPQTHDISDDSTTKETKTTTSSGQIRIKPLYFAKRDKIGANKNVEKTLKKCQEMQNNVGKRGKKRSK